MTYKNFEELPLTLSVEEVAAVLKVGKTTAYNMVRSNQIESVRVGHQIRISKSALKKFLAEGKKAIA